MARYTIIEATSRRDIMDFVKFAEELYKDCPQYVPALRSDQYRSLTSCASAKYCEHKLWLVRDSGGKTAGRICAMINPRYNEIYGKKRARFGWFDTIDDPDVAKLLLTTAEAWAKSMGMNEIHGPLYYNTLGKQGMLIEGFDNTPVFNTLYNYPYYPRLIENLGYTKECDWIEHRMAADQPLPEKIYRIADMLMSRHHLHEGSISRLKKDPERIKSFFQAYNESFFGAVHNFIPFTEEEIKEEAAAFLPYLKDDNCCIILDENEDLAAFSITVPDLSEALKKAKGRLFPTGWFHILMALRKYETMDLLLNGAVPKWQNTGISALFHVAMSRKYKALGTKCALSNPQIETNSAINVWSSYGDASQYMRRRCYIKEI